MEGVDIGTDPLDIPFHLDLRFLGAVVALEERFHVHGADLEPGLLRMGNPAERDGQSDEWSDEMFHGFLAGDADA